MVKSPLHKDLVLYNEDHHPNHIVCFCPRFSFVDFVTHGMIPQYSGAWMARRNWRQKMLGEIPAHLSRRYSWSFCKSASLPRGTDFLKRKMQSAKQRTIISYAQSLCSKLLEMASIASTMIAKTLYSDSPGMQSLPQLWKSLHRHWARPSEEHDVEWNDDSWVFQCSAPQGHPAIGTHHSARISAAHRLLSSLDRFVAQDRTPGCSRRPESVVCRSKEPALATKFPPFFQACRC